MSAENKKRRPPPPYVTSEEEFEPIYRVDPFPLAEGWPEHLPKGLAEDLQKPELREAIERGD